MSLSRSEGVDLTSGTGLADRLAGVDVVIDVTNPFADTVEDTEQAFRTITENLLAAEQEAGVQHHVALSIAGLDGLPGNPHYFGKRAQERAIENGSVPYSIVPATQFHDFPAMIADWGTVDGVAFVPPMLLQPIAPADVAGVLIEIALGGPVGRYRDVAGPRTEDGVDMARRTRAARGDTSPLLASWRGPVFGVEFAGEVMLPGDDAHLAGTTFDDWLASQDLTAPSD